MSYNDNRREDYGQSGSRDSRDRGGAGDSYYDQNQRFDDDDRKGGAYDRQSNRSEGGDGYNRQQSGGYGGRDEDYSRQSGGYGDDSSRSQGRRNDNDDDDRERYGGSRGNGDDDRRQGGRQHEGSGRSGGYEQQSDRYGRREDNDGGYGGSSGYGNRPEQGQGGNSSNYGERPARNDDGYSQRFGNTSNSADFDQDEVLKHSGSGESSLFSTALSFLGNNKPNANDVDEGRLQQSHQQLYQQGGNNQQHDASSLGAGAAMQVFKMFSGGSGGSGNSGGSQSQMMAMAMKEASKLFDSQKEQGNVQSGTDKQSVVNQAAKFALQMYMKNGLGGGSGGSSGGSGGGAGGLLDLASKFLK